MNNSRNFAQEQGRHYASCGVTKKFPLKAICRNMKFSLVQRDWSLIVVYSPQWVPCLLAW
jgi:hypothetical protein